MLAFAWRKHATTIGLTVLALVGAVVIVKVERGSVTTEEAEARRRNLLEAWRDEAITELSVTARGKTARLSRGEPDADGERPWSVEISGQRFEADAQAVDQYLGSLEFGVFERRVPAESVDRAAFKLGDPRVQIGLAMDGRSHRIAIGGEAPTPPGAAYAEVEGRGVVVITAQLLSALDVEPDTFRARRIAPYLAADLAALHLDGEGGPRRLERAPFAASRGQAFRFDGSGSHGHARVGQSALEKLLFAVGSLDADLFLSEDQAGRLPPGRVTLTLLPTDASKPRAVLDIGAPCPEKPDLVAVLRRAPSPLAACAPKSIMDALTMPADALADRKLIAAPIDTITEIKLTSGADSLELARKGTKWHLRAPTDRDVDAAIGRDFLESVLALEATSFAPPSAPPIAAPRARVRLISTVETLLPDAGDGDRIEELEIGPESGGVVLIRRSEDGSLLELPASHAAALFPSDIALRPHTIWDEPAKRFRTLTIKEGDQTQRLRRTDEGAWELLEPKARGLQADIGLATDVAELMGTLKAERWVSATPTSTFGLDQPRMVLEAEVADDDAAPDEKRRTLRLLLGAPAASAGGSFARTSDDNAIFIAPKQLEIAASRWLLDRSVLSVDPTTVLRATLEAPGRAKIILERQPSGALAILESQRPSSAPSLLAKAAAIRDALADLRAEGAVSIGKPEDTEGLTPKPSLTLTIERELPTDAGDRPKRETIRILFGAGDVWRGTNVRYARREGIDATYALAQAKVKPLFEAIE